MKTTKNLRAAASGCDLSISAGPLGCLRHRSRLMNTDMRYGAGPSVNGVAFSV